MHYQLRFPEGTTPDHMADTLVLRTWEAVTEEPDRAQLDPAFRENLARSLKAALNARTYAFDTCGLFRSCLDASRPAAWNTSPGPAGDRRRSVVAHLDAPDGLDALEAELIGVAIKAAGLWDLGESYRPRLRARLRQAVRGSLGGVLFESDLCELPQIMRVAEPAPPLLATA